MEEVAVMTTFSTNQIVELTGVPESTLRVWERNAITAKALEVAKMEVPPHLTDFLDYPVPARKAHRRRDRRWTAEEMAIVRTFAKERGYVPN